MKLITRTRIQLDSETISVASVSPWVVVIISIAVDDNIESSVFELCIAGVVAFTVLTETLLKTRVLIAIEAAKFHYAVATLKFHTIISRMADVETTIMPVVGTYLVHDTSVVSSLCCSTAWLSREVEYRALCVTRIGKHTDALVCSTCLSHIDGL